MILAIDAGNSHTVAGLYEGDGLRGHWRFTSSLHRTTDELRIFMRALLREEGVEPDSVRGCCIASVVPALTPVLETVCLDVFGEAPVVVGPGVKTGLIIKVDNPKEVGADRIANAVGAIESYGGDLIVVDFGTATTFDVVSAAKEYRGGAIVPGIQISADALFEKCAKLPRVEIAKPPVVIGRDTVSHIRSGLTFGYADLVDGLIARMTQEMAARPTVAATGGFASIVAGIAKRIDHVDPHLTLKGLRSIFLRNAQESP